MKRKAFSLIEMLVAFAAGSLLIIGIFAALRVQSSLSAGIKDSTAAHQEVRRLFGLLDEHIRHAGLDPLGANRAGPPVESPPFRVIEGSESHLLFSADLNRNGDLGEDEIIEILFQDDRFALAVGETDALPIGPVLGGASLSFACLADEDGRDNDDDGHVDEWGELAIASRVGEGSDIPGDQVVLVRVDIQVGLTPDANKPDSPGLRHFQHVIRLWNQPIPWSPAE